MKIFNLLSKSKRFINNKINLINFINKKSFVSNNTLKFWNIDFKLKEISLHQSLLAYIAKIKKFPDKKEKGLKLINMTNDEHNTEISLLNIISFKLNKSMIDEIINKLKEIKDNNINIFFDGGCSGQNKLVFINI